MAHLLIIGGSGGIAQGLWQHYLAIGWQVSVLSRQPAPRQMIGLDWYQYASDALLHPESTGQQLHAALRDNLTTIFHHSATAPTLVFCCIGVLQTPTTAANQGLIAEKNIGQLSSHALQQALLCNTVLPALWLQQLWPFLRQSPQIRLCWLSAKVGSISDNQLGGWYSYRASKAALNMLVKTFAIELRRTLPQACAISLHPGTTDTDLSKPFQRNLPSGQLQSPAQTAARLATVAAGLTPAQSGALLNWDGTELPF